MVQGKIGKRALQRLQASIPWIVSPVVLLEIQYLQEVTRRDVIPTDVADLIRSDERFVIDDPKIGEIVEHARHLTWTRDPFDRLIAAHSSLRGITLCTTDERILAFHADSREPS